MSKLKFTAPALILAAGFLLCSTTSYAKKEYAVATKKSCTFCHSDMKKPAELTAAGKYFKEHNNSLEGYKQ